MIAKVLASVLFTLSVAFLTLAATSYYELHHKALPPIKTLGSIVRLVQNDRTYCSGTVVDDTTIITAAHCIIIQTPLGDMVNDGDIEVRSKDNFSRNTYGKVRAASPQMDYAVLKGNFKIYDHRTIVTDVESLSKKRDKSAVFTSCGYPLGGNLYCTNVRFLYLQSFMWGVDSLLLPGMSGGPVLDEDGAVVAINHGVQDSHSIVSPTYNLDKEF